MFFFFKHKTAYEMRISDWSSDVCSSDLNDDRNRRYSDQDASYDRHGGSNTGGHGYGDHDRDYRENDDRDTRSVSDEPEVKPKPKPKARENGRAWCRERVCKYG